MNKDSSLLLLHWIKSAGSLLIPSFLGPPPANPVHPPSSTAPSPETPDVLCIPVITISSHTGTQPLGLSTPLWRISPSSHCIPVPVPCIPQYYCK
ncbi:hypothetical protein AMECASPLE_024000 [Ameca splendens]|uniref:Secreted protein n=1 Tax=Ameca splendens TaxID=208324 RepID=A0ABV0ZP46_9TELE